MFHELQYSMQHSTAHALYAVVYQLEAFMSGRAVRHDVLITDLMPDLSYDPIMADLGSIT
jgi:hypothetical protein